MYAIGTWLAGDILMYKKLLSSDFPPLNYLSHVSKFELTFPPKLAYLLYSQP